MKHIKLRIAFVLVLMFVGATLCYGQKTVKGYGWKPVFEAGQVWSYKTRPEEKASTLIIVKVEQDAKLGNIVHIALAGLKIKRSGGGILTSASHLPFAEKAIDASVVKMLSKDAELPDYEEGYNLWKEAFDAKKAGIYTITVAEAVGVMEETFNR